MGVLTGIWNRIQMCPFGPVKTAVGISIHWLRKFSRLFSFRPRCASRGNRKSGQPVVSALSLWAGYCLGLHLA